MLLRVMSILSFRRSCSGIRQGAEPSRRARPRCNTAARALTSRGGRCARQQRLHAGCKKAAVLVGVESVQGMRGQRSLDQAPAVADVDDRDHRAVGVVLDRHGAGISSIAVDEMSKWNEA